MMKFQFHLIARNDWDFVLKCKLNWSKNVNEERYCPSETETGLMDPSYCVLTELAVQLEFAIKRHGPVLASPYLSCFSQNKEIPKGGGLEKNGVELVFAKKMFWNIQFQNNELGSLGSHSIRQFAATVARNNGVLIMKRTIVEGESQISECLTDMMMWSCLLLMEKLQVTQNQNVVLQPRFHVPNGL